MHLIIQLLLDLTLGDMNEKVFELATYNFNQISGW